MGVCDPTLLAFDTSGPHIAGAVLHRGTIAAECVTPMKRGQAENLMPMLEELLASAGLDYGDLAALGVGVGPGNFTGIRISVAAARGLALGLAIPAVGISNFEVMHAAQAGAAAPDAAVVSLEAPRGMAYVQLFAAGFASAAPRLIDPAAPPADLGIPSRASRVIGHRAAEIAGHIGATATEATLQDLPSCLAHRAALHLKAADGAVIPRPAPLYVRAPDAAPARDAPPEIVG